MRRRGRPPYPDVLTPRQWEVLALIREGLTDREIAQRLGISLDGVKFHVSEILGKLGVTSRNEAARWSEQRAASPTACLSRFSNPQRTQRGTDGFGYPQIAQMGADRLRIRRWRLRRWAGNVTPRPLATASVRPSRIGRGQLVGRLAGRMRGHRWRREAVAA